MGLREVVERVLEEVKRAKAKRMRKLIEEALRSIDLKEEEWVKAVKGSSSRGDELGVIDQIPARRIGPTFAHLRLREGLLSYKDRLAPVTEMLEEVVKGLERLSIGLRMSKVLDIVAESGVTLYDTSYVCATKGRG